MILYLYVLALDLASAGRAPCQVVIQSKCVAHVPCRLPTPASRLQSCPLRLCLTGQLELLDRSPMDRDSSMIHRCSSSSPSIDNVVRPLTTADTLDRRRRGPAGEDGWDLPVTRQRRPSGRPLATPRVSSANETVKQVPVAIIARRRGSAVLHGRRASMGGDGSNGMLRARARVTVPFALASCVHRTRA